MPVVCSSAFADKARKVIGRPARRIRVPKRISVSSAIRTDITMINPHRVGPADFHQIAAHPRTFRSSSRGD